jgi:3-oxoacyl-[acyl-carrier protein] reductase
VFKTAREAFGQVDILVNNAGTSAHGSFEEISDGDWQTDLDLKFFAAIRLCRLVLPGMKELGWGRVINVLNIGGKAPSAGGAPTAVSRAAGLALTKVLACEYAPFGVLVNSLHVGKIESDQWVQRHKKSASSGTLEEFYADMGKSIPLGRVGKAEEFANVACLLASDAGSYIAGTSINVDGGLCPVT